MPDTSNVKVDMQVAMPSATSGFVVVSSPPGFGCLLPSTPPFSPKYSLPLSSDTFVPSLASEARQVSPRHTFVPLRQHSSSTFLDAVNKNRAFSFESDDTPPVSPPFEMKKVSPTPTVLTVTTLDSAGSSFSMSSEEKSSLPYIPTRPSEMSSLQRALWIPPRSIAVCQIMNSGRATPSRHLSGLSGSFSPAGKYSPTGSYSPAPSPASRKALFSPARVEHDPIRKSRLKTEMCLHFINNTSCPFGANCTYAHGEEELQLTKLMDLHEAGLVDVATYRTVPCLTFVSTGSCPFGKRCHGIHDPRVAGTVQSWLPHTETQGNTIATDINVDALHQKKLYSLLHNNPFGALFSPGKDSFEDLYNLVCNSNCSTQQMSSKKKKGTVPLEEHHKLSIALQMRGGSNFQFKFRPQHIIFDELCMVLQKRAFRLTGEECVEIPLSNFNFRSAKNVLVREVAFGPDCDSTVRGVRVWYGIAESDVTICTPQQAKRYRWKRGLNKKNDANKSRSTASKFDSLESFSMVRPSERDAYGLSTAFLDHRLTVLKANSIPNVCERAIALDRLEKKRDSIEDCFDGLVRTWQSWTWPVNEGREKVDGMSNVPSVDGEYKPTGADGTSSVSTVASVWESFASASFVSLHEANEDETDDFVLPTTQDFEVEASRLKVFKRLSESSSLPCEAKSAMLPHITDTNDGFEVTGVHALQSRRCWKSLLFKPSSGNEYNEWGIVRGHFENSRSRKVLSILQSQ